jgi:hypothetical protein
MVDWLRMGLRDQLRAAWSKAASRAFVSGFSGGRVYPGSTSSLNHGSSMV